MGERAKPSLDRRTLRSLASQNQVLRPFEGVHDIATKAHNISNGVETVHESYNVLHQETVTDATISAVETQLHPDMPVTLSKPTIQQESRGVRLSMFKVENADEVDGGRLAGEFYGYERKWLAASVDKDSERFQMREERLKKARLKKNPSMSPDEYDQQRKAELDKNDRFATRRVNTTFRKTISERFGIPEDQAMNFANDQFTHAADAMRYFTDTLYPHRGALSMRNEAILPPISPAETVKTIASQNTDTVLQFEERRRQLLAYVSAEIETENKSPEAAKKLSLIQALLDRELFSGRTGSTTSVKIRALFNSETNDVLFIDKIDGTIPKQEELYPENSHLKTCEVPMRTIKGTDTLVYTNPNQKRQSASITKAVRKAFGRDQKNKGDLISGAEDVQDIHRIKFAVFSGPDKLEDLVDRVYNAIVDNQHTLTELDIEGQPINGKEVVVKDIRDDSQTNGSKDQSANVSFRRLQVVFSDLPTPVEIMFQTVGDFLKSEYEVGEYDSPKGKYKGAAHELYEIHRLMDIRPLLLPREIYKRVNLTKEAVRTLRDKAQKLLNLKKGTIK